MREGYQPASEFLKAFVGNEQRAVSETDLGQLVTLTLDADASNRDWATFLLAQKDFDTPAIRAALIHATSDTDANVWAEAIWGLAKRDPHLALPLVQEALRADSVAIPMPYASVSERSRTRNAVAAPKVASGIDASPKTNDRVQSM